MIGEYNRVVASPSHQRSHTAASQSTSWQLTPTPILTVAELAALPRDRAVVLPSGAPALLAQPIPWWNTKAANTIRASIDRYDPAAPPATPTQDQPMDHNHLTGEATAGALPGLEPLVKRAVVEALKQHTASMTAAAVARGLADHDLTTIAERAVERELLDLAEPPRPYYPTLPDWVQEWLLPVYRRSISGHHRTWCPQWWRHDEAVTRLDALWRAWEHLRLDPATGLSAWFRDHADHHMTILLDADGPLKGCDGHPLTATARPAAI